VKLGAFHLFERCHRNGDDDKRILLAALHWPWSITWRWLVDWSPWGSSYRIAPLAWWTGNGCGSVHLRLPVVGCLTFAWQENMRRNRASSTRTQDRG
jgi:hypothetical protein